MDCLLAAWRKLRLQTACDRWSWKRRGRRKRQEESQEQEHSQGHDSETRTGCQLGILPWLCSVTTGASCTKHSGRQCSLQIPNMWHLGQHMSTRRQRTQAGKITFVPACTRSVPFMHWHMNFMTTFGSVSANVLVLGTWRDHPPSGCRSS